MLSSTLISLLSLAAVPLVAAHSRNPRHSEAAKRGYSSLAKRDFSGQFTYYADNTDEGACGGWNKPSDYIVALNAQQFNNGQHCGETVTITVNGKTQSATVVDECMGCGFGGLDFSSGLFSSFADLGVGELHGTWSFGSGGGGGGDSPKAPPPATTHEKTSTKPHTTWTPPTTTSKTHSKTHTTTSTTSTKHTTSTHSTTSHTSSSSSSTSSASSSSSVNYNSGAAAGLAQATGYLSQGTTNNLADLNQAFIGLAALFVAASDEN
ncbi:hypothetical protein HWV62_1482 [Athelia sp. TMB]|nr:hypothetical protein HWV62_17288 [Athelia sp. TMB]KAF7978089.1 hypothetical protein HWV62_1482 [Athelia sp. TMB]